MPRDAGGPLLICFDGSGHAKQAIQRAAALLVARDALVLTVWQPTAALGGFAWGGEAAGMVDFVELDRAGAEDAGRIAEEGVRLAREAGLGPEPIAIKAAGPVWRTIVETADAQDAAAIVMGSRGLTGVLSMLL
jgi:nucleotide-binding universal stress UspA family protein